MSHHANQCFEEALKWYDKRVASNLSAAGFGVLATLYGPENLNEDFVAEVGSELEQRMQRHDLEARMRFWRDPAHPPHVHLMRLCFKQWPLSNRVVIRKLMLPIARDRLGLPVHGLERKRTDRGRRSIRKRVMQDNEGLNQVGRAQTFPSSEEVSKAFEQGSYLALSAYLLWQAGMNPRQIGEFLHAIGATSAVEGTRTKQAQRMVKAGGERWHEGKAPRLSMLTYERHEILKILLSTPAMVTLLRDQAPAAGGLLMSVAEDLLQLRVRMSLVELSPDVLAAHTGHSHDPWPALLERLEPDRAKLLDAYAFERATRQQTELALGTLGLEKANPLLRPVWRSYIVASLLHGITRSGEGLEEVVAEMRRHLQESSIDLALLEKELIVNEDRSTSHLLLSIARHIHDVFVAFQMCNLAHALLLQATPGFDEIDRLLDEAQQLSNDYAGLRRDFAFYALVVLARRNGHLPAKEVGRLVNDRLEAYISLYPSVQTAIEKLRHAYALEPGVVRELIYLAKLRPSTRKASV